MAWFGDCFSLLVEWCTFEVVIHLRSDVQATIQDRRVGAVFSARVCSRLAGHQTKFSWQANIFVLVEHGQLRFRSLPFPFWSLLRSFSRGALQFWDATNAYMEMSSSYRRMYGRRHSLCELALSGTFPKCSCGHYLLLFSEL